MVFKCVPSCLRTFRTRRSLTSHRNSCRFVAEFGYVSSDSGDSDRPAKRCRIADDDDNEDIGNKDIISATIDDMLASGAATGDVAPPLDPPLYQMRTRSGRVHIGRHAERDRIPRGPAPLPPSLQQTDKGGISSDSSSTGQTGRLASSHRHPIPFKTDTDIFGQYRVYRSIPCTLPDAGTFNAPVLPASIIPPKPRPIRPISEIIAPCPNLSAFYFQRHHWLDGQTKSLASRDALQRDVFLQPDFNLEDVKHLNLRALDTQLADSAKTRNPLCPPSEGWQTISLNIQVPPPRQSRATAAKNRPPPPPCYVSVPGLRARKLTDIMRKAFSLNNTTKFHYEPFASYWVPPGRPRSTQSLFVGPQEEGLLCKAADEACIVNRAEQLEMDLTSHWEINLNLPAETDALLILSACYAIAQDKKARNYALREYNCYFFSWTIVMLVTRHLLPFTVPSPAAVQFRFDSRLADGSAAISDIIVKALLDIVLNTVAAIDSVTGKRLNKGLSKRELAVWGLPAPIFRTLLSQCLKIRLRCGLKQKLDERVRFQLETRSVQVLQYVLGASGKATEGIHDSARGVEDAVQNRLWLNQLLTDVQKPIHEEILQILWDSILDAIAEGYGDAKVDEIHQGFHRLPLLQRLKYYLFGKNVIQFSQIWSEALRAALPAARAAGYGQYRPEKTHGDMFDLTFGAGAAEALRAAQDVVRKTGPELANPKRDEMWEFVWDVWDDIWELSRTDTQAMIVSVVESTLAEIVGWVAEDVVKELGDNNRQKVQATIRFKRNQKKRLQGEGAELSLEVFQLNIRKFIQSVPGQTLEHKTSIEEAMSRAWDVSRKTYKPLDEVAP